MKLKKGACYQAFTGFTGDVEGNGQLKGHLIL